MYKQNGTAIALHNHHREDGENKGAELEKFCFLLRYRKPMYAFKRDRIIKLLYNY